MSHGGLLDPNVITTHARSIDEYIRRASKKKFSTSRDDIVNVSASLHTCVFSLIMHIIELYRIFLHI